MQKLPIIMLIAVLSVGCSNLRFPWVYRIDIPQGNFVTEEMLAELQPGMTPEQVEYVLGVPTVVDPFTPDTWFYLMTYEPGKGDTVSQEIVVHFADGSYSHYDGQVVNDLKARTSGGSDRQLKQRAEERQRGVDSVAAPAPADAVAETDAKADADADADTDTDTDTDTKADSNDADSNETAPAADSDGSDDSAN